ncbi:MRH4 (YGL064C) [Zygosaccharomyces parabailii]|nr:MRH4 (YGL064C) [Zygosaccharomyces parabailii]
MPSMRLRCLLLTLSVRRYATRLSRPPSRKALKLASAVGSQKKLKSPKKQSPSVFHFGNFSGLKENDGETTQKAIGLISKITDFDQLKLLPNVRTAIKQLISLESLVKDKKIENIRPSPIQVVAIKKLSSSLMDPKLQLHAIAAETGSGKTMAYFAPLVDYLKRFEAQDRARWLKLQDKPIIRAVVLVPTHELVTQVYNTVERSEALLGLHTYKWASGVPYSDFLNKAKDRIDILVTTPAKLLSLFKIRMISRPDKLLSQVKFVVLDEADTLLDQSWVEDTHSAINKMPNVNHVVFCSATIPNEFNKTMQRLFPTVVPITTPRLHKLPSSLEFKVIDAAVNPYKNSKVKALAQVLYAITNDGTEANYEKRCIVFVNEKKDVPILLDKLTETYGHLCVGLTGDDNVDERFDKVQAFLKPPRLLTSIDRVSETEASSKTYKIPDSNIALPSKKNAVRPANKLRILVTTDLMARGLNFQGVRNVVLFDVPKTSIDLVHRVGRTGRMRQGGRVFMIVDKSTKSWAKAIPKVAKRNMALV